MTVQPISDEQLVEVERLISQREPSYENRKIMNATISAIIARLRAAEADAKRYRWLRSQPNDCSAPRIDICHWQRNGDDSVNEGEGLRLEEADKAIDAAMERTP
ncbi:hypothetical protein [Pseudomonas aeruginosa]|uniref:hypothetical protein n=1 Tax=Pseudomonas aeruginosa TaxID=287 RepID=UPI0022EBC1E3|nr:hypothetical protein [Pseudomonas aeruginosa]